MKDSKTLAHINLFAVLANISNLVQLDSASQALVAQVKTSISFSIIGGLRLTLVFANGKCWVQAGGGGKIQLWFRSASHFNRMMEAKAQPILLRGFSKLKFLTGNFAALSKRLEHFLKPESDQLFEDPHYRNLHTQLVIFTAINAAVEVANTDPLMRGITVGFPQGEVAFEVEGGPAYTLMRGEHGLQVKAAPALKPRAAMTFTDLDAAFNLLNGFSDSYSTIACEKLRLSGFIPMLEAIDKYLFRVNYYLK